MRARLRAFLFVILLLPLDFLVVLGLLFGALMGSLAAAGFMPAFKNKQKSFSNLNPGIKPAATSVPAATILIANWDGKHLLAECLPSVIEAVKVDGGQHEILVV